MYDHEYLLNLIANHIEEGPELEYKAAGALQRNDKKVMEITKDVSSFANSNGGILIYGIAEEQADKRFPGKIDSIDCKTISKEWLEQIINSRIRPRIHSLKIHVVSMPENQDQVVYILEIPKGKTAHQADDKRYYRRHNFMVEALYDHEVRDIMGRQKTPEILVHLAVEKKANIMITPDNKPMLNQQTPYFYWLNVDVENIGKIYAKYINILFTLPMRCLYEQTIEKQENSVLEIIVDNKVRDALIPENAQFYTLSDLNKPKQYGPARYEPLLPGMRVRLRSIPISQYATNLGNEINWTLYADNAEPKNRAIEFCALKQF